jgi:hypothetical protein
MEQSFKPTEELIQFMKHAERTENVLLQKRNITLTSLRTQKTITHTHTHAFLRYLCEQLYFRSPTGMQDRPTKTSGHIH